MSDSVINAETSDVLLTARDIHKSFPGVRVLDGVDITVRRGRLNALLGENGAGKSTLMNILAGVFPPDAGKIILDGKPVTFANPRSAQLAGISIIFQELNLVPHMSIAENIFLGREPRTASGLLDIAQMNRDASVLLAELEMAVSPRTLVSQLRVGAQQIVEIAKAISFNSRVIIMDEPTSAISEHEVGVLFRLIARLKKRGTGIIYISHKLDELPVIADDITVLRDGKLIAAKPFQETTRDEMVRLMVGRELTDCYPKTSTPGDAEVLRVENLTLRHPVRANDFAVRDVSFQVRKGEVLGIFGLMGAGRTELLQTIFGLHPRTSSGNIWIEGKPVSLRSPRAAIDAGLALAPEDRKGEGLVLIENISRNTVLACLKKITRFGILRIAKEREIAAGYVSRLRVRTPGLHQAVRNLSGGNQQKVVLAKWLSTSPKVLLLDEPTRGIDINAKKEIYTLVDELAHSGLAVVMVSSELPEIMGIADRILVLSEGRLTAEFKRGAATEESILHAALPRSRN